MRYLKSTMLFVVALCFGFLLYKLGTPIPFMLAAMLAGMFANQLPERYRPFWPMWGRNAGLLVVGYAIGAGITIEAWHDFCTQFLTIVLTTTFVVGVSALIAFAISRLQGADLLSSVLGMMPGGLAMIMVLVEENKRVDPNITMVMQVLRLFGVIFTVPFLAISFMDAKVLSQVTSAGSADGIHWLVFIPLGFAGALFFEKFHLPIPWMLGPAFSTGCFVIMASSVQSLPFWVMWPAQVAVGLKMGMLLEASRVWATKKYLPSILLGTGVLIGSSYVMALFLHRIYGEDMITAFLALSPGGISEMSIAGLSMGADVAIILAYQLLRIFSISWLVPYVVKWEERRETGCRG